MNCGINQPKQLKMPLPKVIEEIIEDYHAQLMGHEMRMCLVQHTKCLEMHKELLFAHNSYTTYRLEFARNPPIVIRRLAELRGFYTPDTPNFISTDYKYYSHPKVSHLVDYMMTRDVNKYPWIKNYK